jgi:alpha-ketoglutarate-dependent taurine dioxygenase
MASGVAPVRSRDPERIRHLVERDGAAILIGWGTGAEDAVAAAGAVFGADLSDVLAPTEVGAAGGPGDGAAAAAHTDGSTLGDRYPDYVLLSGAAWSGDGGDSFVVDGEAVVDHLAGGPGGRELVHRLQRVAVDHGGPGAAGGRSTVIGRTLGGRLMLRRFPSPTSARPEEDAAMLRRWEDTIDAAAALAPRFAVQAGDVVVIDNYRMMHGGDLCGAGDRRWWRVWAWSTSADGRAGRERSFDPRAEAS